MSHDRWDDLLLDEAYGELGPGDRAALDAHLAGCPRCREERAAMARTLAAVRAMPPEPDPTGDLGPLLAAADAEAARLRASRPGRWARLLGALGGLALRPAGATAALVAVTTAGMTWLLVDRHGRGELALDALPPPPMEAVAEAPRGDGSAPAAGLAPTLDSHLRLAAPEARDSDRRFAAPEASDSDLRFAAPEASDSDLRFAAPEAPDVAPGGAPTESGLAERRAVPAPVGASKAKAGIGRLAAAEYREADAIGSGAVAPAKESEAARRPAAGLRKRSADSGGAASLQAAEPRPAPAAVEKVAVAEEAGAQGFAPSAAPAPRPSTGGSVAAPTVAPPAGKVAVADGADAAGPLAAPAARVSPPTAPPPRETRSVARLAREEVESERATLASSPDPEDEAEFGGAEESWWGGSRREKPLPRPVAARKAAPPARQAGPAIAAHAADAAAAAEVAAEAERLYAAAERARTAERFDEAVAFYLRVADGHPTHPRAPEALLAAARIRRDAGDLAAARRLVARLESGYGGTAAAADARRLLPAP